MRFPKISVIIYQLTLSQNPEEEYFYTAVAALNHALYMWLEITFHFLPLTPNEWSNNSSLDWLVCQKN
jgi:hypothetical protein